MPMQHLAAINIQRTVRGGILRRKRNQPATKIQQLFRGFYSRKYLAYTYSPEVGRPTWRASICTLFLQYCFFQ